MTASSDDSNPPLIPPLRRFCDAARPETIIVLSDGKYLAKPCNHPATISERVTFRPFQFVSVKYARYFRGTENSSIGLGDDLANNGSERRVEPHRVGCSC